MNYSILKRPKKQEPSNFQNSVLLELSEQHACLFFAYGFEGIGKQEKGDTEQFSGAENPLYGKQAQAGLKISFSEQKIDAGLPVQFCFCHKERKVFPHL